MLTHTKRLVSITLDVECYDDFHPEDLDWNDILDLEGDEQVHVSIKDYADIFKTTSSKIGTISWFSLQDHVPILELEV